MSRVVTVLLVLVSTVVTQAQFQFPPGPPLTATTQTPVPGWTCITHPYPVLADNGWVLCNAPQSPSEEARAEFYRIGMPGDLLVHPTSAAAKAGVLTYANSFDFPEVPIGQPGADNDFMAVVLLKNKTTAPSLVTLIVTKVGEAPIARSFALGPQARRDPLLNDWPELEGFVGGVTLEVKMEREGTAGVAVRSNRDFWRTSTILHGLRP